MRRFYSILCVIFFSLSLGSCSSVSAKANMEEIRGFLSSCGNMEIRAAVTADYGDRVFEYTLKYSGTSDSGVIEIISPDIVAGVRARVSFDDGIKLEYDGVSLDTGKLYEDGLSPVDAIPVMLRQWTEGYVSDCSSEKYGDTDCTAATIAVSDEVTLRTWFDSASLLPVHSELAYNGFVVINCDFENISTQQ